MIPAKRTRASRSVSVLAIASICGNIESSNRNANCSVASSRTENLSLESFATSVSSSSVCFDESVSWAELCGRSSTKQTTPANKTKRAKIAIAVLMQRGSESRKQPRLDGCGDGEKRNDSDLRVSYFNILDRFLVQSLGKTP